MKKIFYELNIGYVGCGDEGEMDVDDNATDAEIDAMVHDMAIEHANSWEGDERLGWHSDMSDEEREEETEYFYGRVEGTWRWAD